MSVTFNRDPKDIFADFKEKVDRSIETGLKLSSEFMLKQLDLSFDNKGFQQVNKRGYGFDPFEPTSIAAKRARKTYPRSSSDASKNNYVINSNSLQDTGTMRESLTIEEDENTRYIGVGVPYIKTSEEGGIIKVGNRTFDVPARPFQHITEAEQSFIIKIFEAAFI